MQQAAKLENPSSPTVFLRNASGLVKSAGIFDVFTYNLGLISVGIAVSLVHYWVPANYPGANLALAEIFGAVAMALIAWGFWAWSVTIPRSGGVYAYVSRALSPAIGFAISFVDTMSWLFYNSLAATFLTTIGIAPLLFVLGVDHQSPALVRLAIRAQQPLAEYLIGAAAICIAGLILIKGMRAFFRLQKLLFAAGMLGTLATLIVLWKSSPSDFHAHFSRIMSAYINDSSLFNGAQQSYGFSLRMTSFAAVWPILSFVGSIFSVNIGGEVRQVQKSQAIGMFGSIIVAATMMVLLSQAAGGVFGSNFQADLANYNSSHPLPIPPYFTLLAAIASDTSFGIIAVCVTFFAWAFFWIPATLVYAARGVLAWSFDRLTPASFGFVHPRWHTPVTAVITVVIINLGFLALFVFTPFFGTLVLALAAMMAWIPTMLGAIIFPFWRKEMYAQSYLADKRLFGVPLLSAAGVCGLISVCALAIRLWNDPIAAGHSPPSLITISSLFVIGIIWYYAAYHIRKRQGIELSRAFQQIPIE